MTEPASSLPARPSELGRLIARVLVAVFALIGALPLALATALSSGPLQRWAEHETARVLREELGETYGVGVGRVQQLPQRGAAWISVSFTGAPENAPGMVKRVQQEIERLQKEGPSVDLTTRAKESARRERRTKRRAPA